MTTVDEQTHNTVGHAAALFARLMRLSFRDPAFAYVFPAISVLGLVAIMSQVYSRLVTLAAYPTDQLIDWMGPGMIFMAGTMGAGFSATVLVTDANNGFLDRLRVLPVHRRAILIGALAFEAVRALPIIAVLVAVSTALGMPAPPAGSLVLAVALATVWTVAWNALFIAATLRTRSPEMPQTLLPLFLPLFFTSSIIVPRANMPSYVQSLAHINPLEILVHATRPGFITGLRLDLGDVALAATVALGVLVALTAAASATLARLTHAT